MDKGPVILFDGVCNLCNGAVQFVIRHDKANLFRFASLQSAFGQKILAQYNLSSTVFSSFILVEDNRIYTKSTGALKVSSRLNGYRWTKFLLIIPSFLRNFFYNLIAKNRYRWFGKQEACWLPTPELKAKFLQ